jgi:hypothetical protein
MAFLNLPIGVGVFTTYLLGFFICHYFDTKHERESLLKKTTTGVSSVDLGLKHKKVDSSEEPESLDVSSTFDSETVQT